MNKISASFAYFMTGFAAFALPLFVFAQRSGGIKDLMLSFGRIITILIPMAAACALLFFFWGLAKFIFKLGNGDESAVEEGKEIMKWGIIALFVMVSIWGITAWIGREIGIPDIENIGAPRL